MSGVSEFPKARGKQTPSAIEKRARIRAMALSKILPPDLTTCYPQGTSERTDQDTLHRHMQKQEGRLRLLARNMPEAVFFMVSLDKARQNQINRLGQKEGAGDAALRAYWDLASICLRTVAGIRVRKRADAEIHVATNIARVSPRSDEAILSIAAPALPSERGAESWFLDTWEDCRILEKYTKYEYDFVHPKGSFRHNLWAFSRVLEHPEMVVSCHREFYGPEPLKADAPAKFLLEAIKEMENREVDRHRHLLPERLGGNTGIPEVESPFNETLEYFVKDLTPDGLRRLFTGASFVEIKFELDPRDALALEAVLPITKKGHTEIYSGISGMRGFNTFLGKACANRLLSPVTKAMFDLETSGLIMPITSNYLSYFVGEPPSPELEQKVARAIREGAPDTGPAFLNVLQRPRVRILSALDTPMQHFDPICTLKALGVDASPEILEKADFIMNFMENVQTDVKRRILEALEKKKNGGKAITARDYENIDMMLKICKERRTIRDAQDMVWVLRGDKTIPALIGVGEERVRELEDWIFEFADERYEKISFIFAKLVENVAKLGPGAFRVSEELDEKEKEKEIHKRLVAMVDEI